MTPLLRPVTKMKCSMPASRASSTTCWISGRSTTVSISLGIALVAGRNRVPRPATGNTAFLTFFIRSPSKFRRAAVGGQVERIVLAPLRLGQAVVLPVGPGDRRRGQHLVGG